LLANFAYMCLYTVRKSECVSEEESRLLRHCDEHVEVDEGGLEDAGTEAHYLSDGRR